MNSFMGWLERRMKEVDLCGLQPPNIAIRGGEEVIGVVTSDVVKRLWGVMNELHGLTNGRPRSCSLEELNSCPVTPEEIVKRWVDDGRYQAVSCMLWAEINSGLDDASRLRVYNNTAGMALREGWKIVLSRSEGVSGEGRIGRLLGELGLGNLSVPISARRPV